MRLYGAIEKVEPLDDGTVRVHGIATSESIDDQGEIVRADAIRAALPDYMRFPALREMHQLMAAGTTLEAEVGDDGATRIVAHVVDPIAVAKVKNQVYRGFSIGGRVTRRDVGNPKAITGIVLSEISLVDRPANPEAVFDCWKAAATAGGHYCEPDTNSASPAPAKADREIFNLPVQIWACGVPGHRHRAKSEAVKCLETWSGRAAGSSSPQSEVCLERSPEGEQKAERADRSIGDAEGNEILDLSPWGDRGVDYADAGKQANGERRHLVNSALRIGAPLSVVNTPPSTKPCTADQIRPLKAEIVDDWQGKIDDNPPPSIEAGEEPSSANTTDYLSESERAARIIQELEWLRDALGAETAMAGDDSFEVARLRANIAKLCSLTDALRTENLGEISGDKQIGDNALRNASELSTRGVGGPGAVKPTEFPRTENPGIHASAGRFLAKQSQADRALIDIALNACDRCLKIGGLPIAESQHMDSARHHLVEAGAVAAAQPSEDTPGYALEFIAKVNGSRGRSHQDLMNVAHQCIRSVIDGIECSGSDPRCAGGQSAQAEEVPKTGTWPSDETIEHLYSAHRDLVAAGALCNCGGEEAADQQLPTGALELNKGLPADLAKVLADERAEKAALVRAFGEMMPMLDRLSKRIDDIACTPLPPLTIARNSVSISKQQDGGGNADMPLSPEAVASALSKMTKEDQTLTLIKASYANPIRVHGPAPGEF
jgi:hypothetical protein